VAVRKARLGPDALDKDFSFTDSAGLLANRDQPIKSLLMDQTKIAGTGNTWSDEILFHARIRPTVAAGALERNQQRALFNSIRNVFKPPFTSIRPPAIIVERGSSNLSHERASERQGTARALPR
jgi:formamidopyrimidine-DNA glycosylase